MRTLLPHLLSALLLLSACSVPDPSTKGSLDSGSSLSLDGDGDGAPADTDCDDGDATVGPSAVEICDGRDNNCDGQVDEGVLSTYYTDADGDGYGDPLPAGEACELPDGAVRGGEDCNDADPGVFPGAPEACDTIDNDCDETIDEEVTSRWYADTDGDGAGDPASFVDDCDPGPGFVTTADDCDDTRPTVFPTAIEVCDELDNDCDETVDEGVTSIFYMDTDGDTFGLTGVTLEACSLPAGWAVATGDCDDANAAVFPGADETCNGQDDDCDTTIDEPDAIDALTYYADADGDSFATLLSSTTACSPPAGYRAVNLGDLLDCDDAAAAIHPGADEVCDGGIDNDCSGLADDLDPGVLDPSDWYRDLDADGHGDPAALTWACLAPAGTVPYDTDCDDAQTAVNPDATEVCNTRDDDCDGLIDDADPSRDASTTGLTFYADADGDGRGNPAITQLSCAPSSGWVADNTDCDDASAADLDGDGLQDCEDPDRDGDGLRDTWDADPEDDAVARGPTAGFGTDGPCTLPTGTTVQGAATRLTALASVGATSITVADASPFSVGDEIILHGQQGPDVGIYTFAFVSAVSGTTLTIEPPLPDTWTLSTHTRVQRVPHCSSLSLPAGATWTSSDWAGAGGGLLVARVSGSATLAGTLTVSGQGYRGGAGVRGNSYDPYQGEGRTGTGAAGTTRENAGGGGSYPRRSDGGDSGGGGGHGAAGSGGTDYNGSLVTAGGTAAGASDLPELHFGGAGGGGSPDAEGDGSPTSNITGDGGDGGGIIYLAVGGTLQISGSLLARGENGDDAISYEGEVGGGGGGAGGTIYLLAPTLSITGTVSAAGGTGGNSAWHSGAGYGSARGGAGAVGRIRLETNSLSGTTSPTASTASFSP